MLRIRFLVTFGIIFLAGAVAILSSYHAERARQQLAVVRLEELTLAQQCRDAQDRLNAMRKESEEIALPVTPLSPVAKAPKKDGNRDSFDRRMQEDPELLNLKLEAERFSIINNYTPFFHAAHFSPQTIDAFVRIALHRQEQQTDIQAVWSEKGLAYDDPAVLALYKKADSDYDSAMRQLLQGGAYAQFQDYERTATIRPIVSAIAGPSSLAGIPFTAEQAERLTTLIATESPTFQQGGPATLYTVNWGKVDENARTILSPAQFQAFTTFEFNGTENNGSRRLTELNLTIHQALAAEGAQTGK